MIYCYTPKIVMPSVYKHALEKLTLLVCILRQKKYGTDIF